MDDTTSLGIYLRAERERRGLTLKAISESTKVSLPLLEGLEADDISRWPGGIFRRAFVRSYAEAVGLDPDAVFRRFEQQHRPAAPDVATTENGSPTNELHAIAQAGGSRVPGRSTAGVSMRFRYIGTAADLTVALVLAFGSAAAGSRLLWPVLMIAAYYAAGILTTGTSPMVALLSQPDSEPTRPSDNSRDTSSLVEHSSLS